MAELSNPHDRFFHRARDAAAMALTTGGTFGNLALEVVSMTVTRADLQDFNRFASAKLASGQTGSLSDLVREWEATREYEGSVAALRESHADAQAGRVKPLDEAFADVREKLSQPE